MNGERFCLTIGDRKILERPESLSVLLPSLAILGVFTFWPIGFSLVLSFFKWDYTSASRYFIGLDNYKELFRISYPVQMNLLYSIINMAVYAVATLVLVQMVHFLLCGASKYDKPEKEHATLYALFAGVLAGYVVLRNLSDGVTMAGILYGLAMAAFALVIFLRRRGSIQSVKMKSSQWVTLILFIGIYYLLSRVLLKESVDFLQYFVLAKESSDFLKSIFNTIYYVVLSVPQIVLALLIAVLLNKSINSARSSERRISYHS